MRMHATLRRYCYDGKRGDAEKTSRAPVNTRRGGALAKLNWDKLYSDNHTILTNGHMEKKTVYSTEKSSKMGSKKKTMPVNEVAGFLNALIDEAEVLDFDTCGAERVTSVTADLRPKLIEKICKLRRNRNEALKRKLGDEFEEPPPRPDDVPGEFQKLKESVPLNDYLDCASHSWRSARGCAIELRIVRPTTASAAAAAHVDGAAAPVAAAVLPPPSLFAGLTSM